VARKFWRRGRTFRPAIVPECPLGFFLVVLKPAVMTLNGLGNLVLRLVRLRPGTGESSLHLVDELTLLVAANEQASDGRHSDLEVWAGGSLLSAE
jgi:CBS domain containing-hemolysin-like protein